MYNQIYKNLVSQMQFGIVKHNRSLLKGKADNKNKSVYKGYTTL